ncbi:MAG: hypothetical protein HYW48_06265 [Deltaproteobacteria bacterium]|nr:hypothetical protein [Deltaproteobacteria bacterium]
MKPVINVKALKASLREAFLSYRRERPHLSLRAIAKHAGVNRYFLSKLIDDDDDNTSLDLSQVLILLQFITERSAVNEIIEASSQEVKDTFGKVFNLDYFGPKRVSAKLQHIDLYDSYNYFVLVLSSYGRGTKREFVSKILGFKGERTLKKLLNYGIVFEEKGRIKLKEGNEFTFSMDVMRQRIPDYLKFYSYDRCLQQRNFIHVYSEGLNEKGVQRVFELHQDLNSKIQKIISDEENWGDIPFFSFACMDRLYDCDEESN